MTLTDGVLRGDVVYLGNYSDDDIDAVIKWYNNMDFARYLFGGLARFDAPKEIREWLTGDGGERNLRPFAIRLLETDQMIGICAIKDIHWQVRSCKFWIGIGEKDMQGKGCGTDAIKLILKYAFGEMNLQRVGLDVGEFNTTACRTYEKLGFQLEGTTRRGQFREGKYWDMYQMGMLREEWDLLQGKT